MVTNQQQQLVQNRAKDLAAELDCNRDGTEQVN